MRFFRGLLGFLMCAVLVGCSGVREAGRLSPDYGGPKLVMPDGSGGAHGRPECKLMDTGMASWYGKEMLGNHTANGEKFNPDGITAAHRKLPFGTIVRVELASGKGNPEGVYVRINDRGPFAHGRIIDLSWGAAKKLGMMDTQKVRVYRCS